MTDRESTPRTPAADDAESERAVAADAVHALVSPTAPGEPDSSKVAVDLPQVDSAAPGTDVAVPGHRRCLGNGIRVVDLVGRPSRRDDSRSRCEHPRLGPDASHGRRPHSRQSGDDGGVTSIALPALVVIGALAPRGRRPLRNRLGAGVLLAGVASAGVLPRARDQCGGGQGASRRGRLGRCRRRARVSLRTHHRSHAVRHLLRVGSLRPGGSGLAPTRPLVRCRRLRVRSRLVPVWLGVHWPTDVLGAWLYATAWFGLSAAAIIGLRSVLAGRRSRRGRPQAEIVAAPLGAAGSPGRMTGWNPAGSSRASPRSAC